MAQTPKSTPRDVFWYLLMIVTLYISVVSLIALLFQYVNVALPDPLEFYLSGALGTIRISMASLMVAVPIYLFISRLIERDVVKHPEKQELKVRKWLLYLTLFIASITIIVDLITLLNSFLSGELTTRFLLKVVIVLVVAAAVFGYYLWDIKRDPKAKSSVPSRAAYAVIAAVIVAVISGFFFIGSPARQRDLRFDEQRVGHLQTLQYGIVNDWQAKRELPASLSELEDPLIGFSVPVDPETGSAYEYRVLGELTFELCATFAEDSLPGSSNVRLAPYFDPYSSSEETWSHGEGRTCFERTIDPDRYPETPKPAPALR